MDGHVDVRTVEIDPSTGGLDLDALAEALSERTAAVYFETPGSLGVIEPDCEQIVSLAHAHGAETTSPDRLGFSATAAAGDLSDSIVDV